VSLCSSSLHLVAAVVAAAAAAVSVVVVVVVAVEDVPHTDLTVMEESSE